MLRINEIKIKELWKAAELKDVAILQDMMVLYNCKQQCQNETGHEWYSHLHITKAFLYFYHLDTMRSTII